MNTNISSQLTPNNPQNLTDPIGNTSPLPLEAKRIIFQLLAHNLPLLSLVSRDWKSLAEDPFFNLKVIPTEEFISTLKSCTQGLKKIAYPFKEATDASKLTPLIGSLPNDCATHVLYFAPPSAACVCKSWQKCYKIMWEQIQKDNPLQNLGALDNERIKQQMSFYKMLNGGQEEINLSFIGKELLKDPTICADNGYQPIPFQSENFDTLSLSEQAKIVTDFFRQNQDKIYSLKLNKINLTQVPAEIFKLKNLVDLSLEDNKIFAIEVKEPVEVEKLSFLSLDDNPLKKYPTDLFKNLCEGNYFHGRYQSKLPYGRCGGGYNIYPRINNSWQYFLTDRCEWKLIQFMNGVYKSMGFVLGLNNQFLKPHKNELINMKTRINSSEADAIQALMDIADSEHMKTLPKKIKPVYELYEKVLSDAATCLISLDFLGELMTSVKESSPPPVWENLHQEIMEFIDTFLLLQDRFVDVEVMKDLIKKYESIIAIIKDPTCFDVDLPNKNVLLENRKKWLEEQSEYLENLKQSTHFIGQLDPTSLQLIKLFMDRSKDDYDIIIHKLNKIALYINEIFKDKI